MRPGAAQGVRLDIARSIWIVVALVLAGIALWFQRGRWPLTIASSAFVHYRLQQVGLRAPYARRTVVVFFRASQCASVLERLAKLSELKALDSIHVVGLVMTDTDVKYVRSILAAQKVTLPLEPIDPVSASAYLDRHKIRMLPAAFEVAPLSIARFGLARFDQSKL